MTTDAAGEPAPPAGAGEAGGARKLGRRLTRWWFRAPAHGLRFPSGHAMVIFAIATLVAPYLKGWWKVLPRALAAAVCLSRVYLGAHFPLDVVAGAGPGMFIGGAANLVLGVPSTSISTPRADESQ